MSPNLLQRLGHRLLERRLPASWDRKFQRDLTHARIGVLPAAYLGGLLLQTILAAVLGALLGTGLALALAYEGVLLALVALAGALLAGGIWWLLGWTDPASKAKKRAKRIQQQLPYAARYLASIASAGVTPLVAFESLGRQPVYGEVAREFESLGHAMRTHGIDLLTAMRQASRKTPSPRLKEFLQGAITTVQSGGELVAYFEDRSERLRWESELEQKSFIETMGLMAETYVTAAVAGPLFLLVIVSVLVIMGNGGLNQLELIVYGLMPIIGVGFLFGVRAMIPEV